VETKKTKRVQKWSTEITDRNGGMHSPVNYVKARNMLLTHPYRNGLMYHLVIKVDNRETKDEEPKESDLRILFRKALDRLCKELKARGMPCRYKACYERDKRKRFHKHVMLLVEAKDVHPDSLIHFKEGDWLTEMMKELGLGFYIAAPDDPMHRVGGKQVNYVYVPKKASPKLEDALVRISYLYKVRSKEGVEGQIYTGSTHREPRNITPLSAGYPAAEETVQTIMKEENDEGSIATKQEAGKPASTSTNYKALVRTGQDASASQEARSEQEASLSHEPDGFNRTSPSDEGKEMILTAQQKYLASLYENCIDADMDTGEIRRYLLAKGVVRTPGTVAWELQHVFCFTGYADSHPPKPVIGLADWLRNTSR
jgi:hypothetical protein